MATMNLAMRVRVRGMWRVRFTVWRLFLEIRLLTWLLRLRGIGPERLTVNITIETKH